MVRTILDIFNAKHDVTAHWWYLRWQSWRQSSPHLLYECVNVGLVGFHYWRIPGKLYCHDDRPLYPWSRWRMLVCRAGCHHISLVQRKGAVFRLWNEPVHRTSICISEWPSWNGSVRLWWCWIRISCRVHSLLLFRVYGNIFSVDRRLGCSQRQCLISYRREW